jgi:hypothetical protein
MNSPHKISIVLCFFLLTSCYESLDFKQLDDFVAKPVFTSALNYFSIVPSQFLRSSNTQELSISDVTDIKGLQDSPFIDDVIKLDFNAEIKNELDRSVTITIELLDRFNQTAYSFTDIVVESKDIDFIYLEEVLVAANPNVLNSSKVKVTLSIENTGDPINISDTSKFEFKSSVTIYIESGI